MEIKFFKGFSEEKATEIAFDGFRKARRANTLFVIAQGHIVELQTLAFVHGEGIWRVIVKDDCGNIVAICMADSYDE